MRIRSLAAAMIIGIGLAGCGSTTTTTAPTADPGVPDTSSQLSIPSGVTASTAAHVYFCLGAGAGDLPAFDIGPELTYDNGMKLGAWLDKAIAAMSALNQHVDELTREASPELAPEIAPYKAIPTDASAALSSWRQKLTDALVDGEFSQADRATMVSDMTEVSTQLQQLSTVCEGMTEADLNRSP